MIVILEGIEASGKTSLGKRLAVDLGAFVFKTLRTGLTSAHWSKGERQDWEGLGVPANHYLEDVYLCDALRALAINGQTPRIILDRSMLSGLSYNPTVDRRMREEILRRWTNWMKVCDARLIYCRVKPETAMERLPANDPRRNLERMSEIQKRMEVNLRFVIPRMKVLTLDSDEECEDEMYFRARRWLKDGIRGTEMAL